jgi:hypothetical protein
MATNSYTVDHGFKALIGALGKLDGMVIKVGIQADAAHIPSVNDQGKQEPISVLDKAIYNEFGRSAKKGETDSADAGHGAQKLPTHAGSVVLPGGEDTRGGYPAIPARPFVSGWADTKEKEIHEHMEAAYLAMIDKGITPYIAARSVGEWATTSMKENLLKYPWTPNAAATIAKKGSSTPLVDESQMINSIRSVVAKEGDE